MYINARGIKYRRNPEIHSKAFGFFIGILISRLNPNPELKGFNKNRNEDGMLLKPMFK
jgi:hypothetical protein